MKRRSFFAWVAGGVAATAAPLAAKAIEASQAPLRNFRTFWKVRIQGYKTEKVITALPPRVPNQCVYKGAALLSEWEEKEQWTPYTEADVKRLAMYMGAPDALLTPDGEAFEFTVSQSQSVEDFIETLSVSERKGLAAALLQAPMAEWEKSLDGMYARAASTRAVRLKSTP